MVDLVFKQFIATNVTIFVQHGGNLYESPSIDVISARWWCPKAHL